ALAPLNTSPPATADAGGPSRISYIPPAVVDLPVPMDFEDSPEDAAFRAEVRAWLSENAQPLSDGYNWSRDHQHPDYPKRCKEWQHTLYEGGWGAITWPTEYGGRGDTAWHQAIFNQEAARYDVSVGVFAVGIGMVG